jgi:hypothetical protein
MAFGCFGRLRVAALFALAAVLLVQAPAVAQTRPIRGEMTMSTTGGYGRLVVRLDAEIEADVRVSSGVLIVQFKQPVDIPVDRITAGASRYFGAARRDPDGRAVRFALQQKLKVSTMTAGERLFIDLLPESWTGEPPGLPREIVEDLARRAKEAERHTQARLALEAQRRIPTVRVRVANQATFTRYIFELPELTPVSSERAKDKLTLTFAGHLRFDLSDAKLSLPKAVDAIDAENDGSKSNVTISFAQPADVRAFREDANYVVDVTPVTALRPADCAAGHRGAGQRSALRCDRARHRTGQGRGRAGRQKRSGQERSKAGSRGVRAAAHGRGTSRFLAQNQAPRVAPAKPSGGGRVAAARRRVAPVLPVRREDAGCGVPARRHALACVRHRGAD